ncbi:3'-5' exonuclease [Granulicella aggregans]|uniref:3'-5' exonuclease n=1 Tax=Granulicella aggregans TaxID=474949 RepID=UPI0021DFE0B0|nr:3'-5' exonuclease [Granulicella aggregans]
MTIEDSKRHERLLYIDTESTFWAGPPPRGLSHEIIEIGVVEMDTATLKITRERSYFVRPKRWEISPRCAKLTGITADDIRTARTFPEVIAKVVKEFSPSTALSCTWGDDAALIAAACHRHGLPMPIRNVLDLAPLFQGLFLLKQMASLHNAVLMLGLNFDGVPHGALPDARNTALLHAEVLRRMRREPDPEASVPMTDLPPAMTAFGEKLLAALERR